MEQNFMLIVTSDSTIVNCTNVIHDFYKCGYSMFRGTTECAIFRCTLKNLVTLTQSLIDNNCDDTIYHIKNKHINIIALRATDISNIDI